MCVLLSVSKLGCGVESGAVEGYFSINVPEDVSIDDCYALIDKAEKKPFWLQTIRRFDIDTIHTTRGPELQRKARFIVSRLAEFSNQNTRDRHCSEIFPDQKACMDVSQKSPEER